MRHASIIALLASAALLAPSLMAQPTLREVAQMTSQLEAEARAENRGLALEEVLFELGDRYPELRENYVLMHNSRSRQRATFEHPRVIAHTPDARFVITFSGDPNLPGYYELEMYEFTAKPVAKEDLQHLVRTSVEIDQYQAEGFNFRRIIFEPRADYPYRHLYDGEKNFPAVKPPNEALCLGCHGRNPRPNWESYNEWEGTYFVDDTRRGGTKYRLKYGSKEHDGFDLFYRNQAGRGRYRFIRGLKERFVLPTKNHSRIPPSRFTQLAGYLNYRRIIHEILQDPQYSQFRYATLGALYNCENFPRFLPAEVHAGMRASLQHYHADTADLFKANSNNFFLQEDSVQQIGKLRYLYEGRGIDMRKWSMNFRRSPYSFVTPGGSSAGFLSSLIISYDSELEPFRVWNISSSYSYSVTSDFAKPWTGSMTTMVRDECKRLQEKSCEAFAADGLPCF